MKGTLKLVLSVVVIFSAISCEKESEIETNCGDYIVDIEPPKSSSYRSVFNYAPGQTLFLKSANQTFTFLVNSDSVVFDLRETDKRCYLQGSVYNRIIRQDLQDTLYIIPSEDQQVAFSRGFKNEPLLWIEINYNQNMVYTAEQITGKDTFKVSYGTRAGLRLWIDTRSQTRYEAL